MALLREFRVRGRCKAIWNTSNYYFEHIRARGGLQNTKARRSTQEPEVLALLRRIHRWRITHHRSSTSELQPQCLSDTEVIRPSPLDPWQQSLGEWLIASAGSDIHELHRA